MEYDYIFSIGPDCMEDVMCYRSGFLHPVEINDTFKNGRYVILHKLGHGGSSTVWLAHDILSTDNRFVALKILGAHASRNVNEIAIHEWLSTSCACFDSNKIARLLDHFAFTGPNGEHVGLVFELYGPSVFGLMEKDIKVRPDLVRLLAKQITHLIKNFHDDDMVVGDLSLNNILLRFSSINDWSVADIYDRLGRPKPWEMMPTNKDDPFPACGPKSLYFSIDLPKRVLPFIEPEVVLIDLNEVTRTEDGTTFSTRASPACYNTLFAGPELVVGLEQQHTKALDIWALACVFFNMRSMDYLIYPGGFSDGSDLIEIQQLLGEVPESLQATIKVFEAQREQSSKVEGQDEDSYPRSPVPFLTSEELDRGSSLSGRLTRIGKWSKFHSMTTAQKIQCIEETTSADERNDTIALNLDSDPYAGPPPARLSDEERADFEDLLKKMLKYQPEERLTISDILEHPWLNKVYNDLDDMGVPWLSRCTSGWQYGDAEDWYEQVIVNGGTWQGQTWRDCTRVCGADILNDDDEIHECDAAQDDTNVAELDWNSWSAEGINQRVTNEQDDDIKQVLHSESHHTAGEKEGSEPSDLDVVQLDNLRHIYVWQEACLRTEMPGTDTDGDLIIQDEKSTWSSEIEGNQANDQDDETQSSDSNTTGRCRLEHVFLWPRQEGDCIDQDHELNATELLGPNTVELQNLEHIFL